MEDHFWPSIYPGIIVGFLIGLSQRSVASTLLGGMGGLIGAYCVFYIIMFLAMEPGLMSVLVVVGGAILAAKLCVNIGSKIIQKIL